MGSKSDLELMKGAADVLDELGISVDKKSIALNEPIKSIGESKVNVKVGYQLTAEITVRVVPETESE